MSAAAEDFEHFLTTFESTSQIFLRVSSSGALVWRKEHGINHKG
jgi:hypothetical protein